MQRLVPKAVRSQMEPRVPEAVRFLSSDRQSFQVGDGTRNQPDEARNAGQVSADDGCFRPGTRDLPPAP